MGFPCTFEWNVCVCVRWMPLRLLACVSVVSGVCVFELYVARSFPLSALVLNARTRSFYDFPNFLLI